MKERKPRKWKSGERGEGMVYAVDLTAIGRDIYETTNSSPYGALSSVLARVMKDENLVGVTYSRLLDEGDIDDYVREKSGGKSTHQKPSDIPDYRPDYRPIQMSLSDIGPGIKDDFDYASSALFNDEPTPREKRAQRRRDKAAAKRAKV